MPLTTCDPCCRPTDVARGQESYRQAMLIILCEILAANTPAGFAEASFDPMVTQPASFFTPAYQLIVTPSAPVSAYTVTNTSDAILAISFDLGVTTAGVVAANATRTFSFGSNNLKSSARLYAKYLTVPSVGTAPVYFETLK